MFKSKNESVAGEKIDLAMSQRSILFVTDQEDAFQSCIKPFEHQNLTLKLALYNGKTLANTPNTPPAAIICYLTTYEAKTASIVSILRAYYGSIKIPIIVVLSKSKTTQQNIFDNIIIGPAHPKQIANRVEAYLRFGTIEQEIKLRKETLEQNFGSYIRPLEDHKLSPFRILFIGKASPSFMIIMNALQKKNVDITAAFTSFSAFDYLHETTFDAVIMNAVEEAEPALSIAETMKRNSRLFHVPTLFVTQSQNVIYKDRAHQKGATDFIDVNSDPLEICGRVLELANYHRLHNNLEKTLQSLGDEITLNKVNKCYNRNFMDKHAKRVVSACQQTNQAISFLALKLIPQCSEKITHSKIEKAFIDIGLTFKSLVRIEDTVSLYTSDTYLFMLANTQYSEAEIILERILALVNCIAFDSGNTQSPLTLTLLTSIANVQSNETSKDTIKRVLHSLSPAPTKTLLQDIA